MAIYDHDPANTQKNLDALEEEYQKGFITEARAAELAVDILNQHPAASRALGWWAERCVNDYFEHPVKWPSMCVFAQDCAVFSWGKDCPTAGHGPNKDHTNSCFTAK